MSYLFFYSLFLILLNILAVSSNASEWMHSNGDFNSKNYSNLIQINENNISDLKKIWIYNSGVIGKKNTVQSTPIFTGKYLITADLKGTLHSINPLSGKLIWKNKLPTPVARRGMTYHDGVIYVPTSKGVAAINEDSGKIIEEMGRGGYFGDSILLVPPIVFQKRIYIATLFDGLKAYNIQTGEELWKKNLSNKEVAPSDGKIRIWSGFSFDEITNTLFVVTSNLGGVVGNDRNESKKDYSSSLVAINALDGNVLWSFQDIKNDLWDFDVVGPPIILDLKIKGKKIRTVIAASKTGNIMIFNVKNGKPLFDNFYKKIKVPNSDVKNVKTSKYQKIFLKPIPISKIYYNPTEDLHYNNLEEKNYLEFKLRNTKFGHYQPPSLNHDIVTFGLHGGPSWTGSSLSNKNDLIIPINQYPWFIRLYYRDKIFSKMSLYFEKTTNFFNFKINKEKNKFKKTRWANDEVQNKYLDKIYSKIPILGNNKVYGIKCSSCHGVAGQGLMENESYGDKYYPVLTGITLTNKKNNLKTLEELKYAHKYEAKFNLTLEEFNSVKSFLYKRDKFLKKLNLLAVNGKWQLFLDKNKLPASKPPWGKIISINTSTAEINWEIPFGKRNNENDSVYHGDINFGGILNIGSGIFFATGTPDEKLSAYRASDGSLLWSDLLPAAGSAPPMTFKYNNCQYIVVTATGGRFVGFKKNSDATVAYKLNKCKN